MDLSRVDLTSAMLRMVAEVDSARSVWVASAKLEPERLKALRRVATIESIGSSTRIEGSRLTDDQVAELLGQLSMDSFADRDSQEVAGYAHAMDLVFDAWAAMPPTEGIVKQLHRDLLQYSSKDERHRGSWKKHPNTVEAFAPDGRSIGVVFETATPFETARRMEALLSELANELDRREHHPLIIIGCFVVEFLAIHPFQDGNGRLSRILTTLLLLRAGYAYVPYASLESIIERSNDRYYGALRATQKNLLAGEPDYGPWLEFFLASLQRQVLHLQSLIERAERDALGSMPLEPALQSIVELVVQHQGLSMGQLVALTSEARSLVRSRVKRLVSGGHLVLHGRGRGAWYSVGASPTHRERRSEV